MWGRFFDSFATANDDTDSVVSGSHHNVGTDLSHPNPFGTPIRAAALRENSGVAASPFSEVHPNDSASMINDDEPSIPPAVFGAGTISNVGGKGSAPVPVEDGTYVFKFRTPSGRTHRFQARHDDVEILRDIVQGKLSADPFFLEDEAKEQDGFPALVKPDPTDFSLAYVDNDGDTVLITTDGDVVDAVKVARTAGVDRVVLLIQGGKGWEKVDVEAAKPTIVEPLLVSLKTTVPPPGEGEVSINDTPVDTKPPPAPPAPQATQAIQTPFGSIDDQQVMGIPRDLVLPASLGFLGVVVIGVFIASRLGSSNRY